MTFPILSELRPQVHDLGGFQVRRVLPAAALRTVGPFIFFDHMGPAEFAFGHGIDVRPHPHIGLATVTYLFDGALMHRDSLGSVQRIAPGDVNWMTAGRGIVHSERTPVEDRAAGSRVHGIQSWIALPQEHEQTEPGFSHHPRASLPRVLLPGVEMTLIAGTAFGRSAPVPTYSRMSYLAVELEPGAVFELGAEYEQRGVYAVEGGVKVADQALAPGHLAVLQPTAEVEIRAESKARLMLLGGDKLDGERHIWWNFVSSSRERIEEAKVRWRERRFAPVPGETEFIPLPP